MTTTPKPATILQSFIRAMTDDEFRQTFALVDAENGTADLADADAVWAEAVMYFDLVAPADRLLAIEDAVANGLRHCRAPLPGVCPTGLRRIVGPGRTRPHFVLSNVETLRRFEDRLRRTLRAGYHEANILAADEWREGEGGDRE